MKKRLAHRRLWTTPPTLKAPEVAPSRRRPSPFIVNGRMDGAPDVLGNAAIRDPRKRGVHARFRKVAKRDGLLLAQLLEKALDAYESR